MNKKLDEKGFVFLDDKNRPYWCCMYHDTPWIMYWHPDKRWVTLRQVNQTEIWSFWLNKLADEHAEMYHKYNAAPVTPAPPPH